jgi:hypothetical protein
MYSNGRQLAVKRRGLGILHFLEPLKLSLRSRVLKEAKLFEVNFGYKATIRARRIVRRGECI